jgi:N-acetylmuramoyl-L-alanine amidase
MKDLIDTLLEVFLTIAAAFVVIYVILTFLAFSASAAPVIVSDAEKVVASTIVAEARGEGNTGMYAVGCVILQRSINRKLSPDKVCLQRHQFSCWNNAKDTKTYFHLLNTKEGKYSLILAKAIVESHKDNKEYLILKHVNNADHYYSTKYLRIDPYWAKDKKPVKIIKNHRFYKLK